MTPAPAPHHRPIGMPTSQHPPALATLQAARRRHWDRLALAVRLGWETRCDCAIRRYLLATEQLIDEGWLPLLQGQQRALGLLLQTVHDTALPALWRWRCLLHARVPLLRLHELLALHDPLALQACEGALQAAAQALRASASAGLPHDDPAA